MTSPPAAAQHVRKRTVAKQHPTLGFGLLVAMVSLVGVGKAVLYDTLDPDSFLHMLAADQMMRDGIGPIVDKQSFASIQSPWTPYSWLGALAMKAVWDTGGYRAAVAAHALMSAALLSLIALSCRVAATSGFNGTPRFTRQLSQPDGAPDGAGLRCIIATTFATLMTLAYLSFRPVTMALVLLALVCFLLLRDRKLGERSRAVWFAIPITALLINLHPFAIVVPMLAAALLIGALWERRRRAGPPDWVESERRVRRYEVLFVGVGVACLATPMLPGVVQSILQLQFSDPMVKGNVVSEYRPFYHGGAGKVALSLVVACAGYLFAGRKKLRLGEVLWLLIGFGLLLRMGRLAPVFAITTAPFLAALFPRGSDRVIARPATCFAVAAVLLLGVIRIGWSFPRPSTPMEAWANRHGPDTPGYPTEAAMYVDEKISPKLGRIINEYTWGGYIEWRLGNKFQALLDGRTNLYTRDFWKATYLGSEVDRLRFFANVRADVAILPVERSRFREPLAALGWTTVYRDERAEVLIPPPMPVVKAQEPNWRGIATLLFEE
jgi:hypothetical protein